MTGLEKLNFFLSTYGRMFVALFNVRLWPPFFIYLLVMLVIVLGVYWMFSPLLAGWLIPLAIWITGDGVLHYPQHLALMPYTFQMLNLATSLLIESLLTAAGVLMFASYFRRETPAFIGSTKAAAKSYYKVVIIWVVNVVLIYLLFKFLPGLFRDFVHGSPRREIALMIGMQGLSALLSALFIYAIPYLVVRGRSLGASFSGSFNLFFKNFFTTYFLVAVPQLLSLLLIIPLQNTGAIVTKFNPEVVVLMTFGMVAMFALIGFFTTGSIVRFFLEVSEE